MKNQIMSILFYLNKAKTNQRGVCPIYCRITYLKKRREFSTGQFVNPKHWNPKKQKVEFSYENSEYVNSELLLITQKLNHTYLTIKLKDAEFEVFDILDLYFGRSFKKEDNVINAFKRYLNQLEKLIGKDIKKGTYAKFDYTKQFVEDFIRFKFGQKDITLKKLDLQFLREFEFYLKTERNLAQITINKVIQRFRKPIKIAISEGFLDKDPFLMYKSKTVKKEIIFLSPEELQSLEKRDFIQPKLRLVKDLFIFSCYTGLAYNEISKLESKHINRGFDDNLWIHMTREKTSKPFSIPLLPKAIEILSSYQNDVKLIFPKISNQKYNSYLKEIADVVAIDKNLTTHTARRTFASTVLLYNDVPMEVVSELLGHSNMKFCNTPLNSDHKLS